MKTFRVKNFETFQHYKDRAPPWIKLYNELLDDYEFGLLPDATKMHLVAIWLLASRSANKIPFDPKWVARRINANDPVDLKLLVDRGFILLDQELQTVEHVASTAQAGCLSRGEGQVEDIKQTEKIAEAKAPEPKPEKKSRSKPKVTIPDEFTFGSAVRLSAVALGFSDSEIVRELQRFIRHAKQNDRRCADWQSAAENWFDKAAEFAGKTPPQTGPPADDGMIEVLGEEELTAWDRYAQSRGAKRFPRNKRGGWRFPSRWPPGYVPTAAKVDPPPVPNLRAMQ